MQTKDIRTKKRPLTDAESDRERERETEREK